MITNTWIGPLDGAEWLTDDNWSLGHYPAAGELIDIGSTSSQPIVEINNEQAVDLYDSLANFGTVALNASTSVNQDAQIFVSGDDSLTGGGTILLGDSANNQIYSLNDYTLDNVDNTIEGAGLISCSDHNLTVINGAAGTIDGMDSDVALTISGLNGLTNNGLLEATAAGTGGLVINTTNVDQSGGGNLSANGGNVYLEDSDIIGGTLSSSGGGVIESEDSELDGSETLPGTITAGSEVEIVNDYNLVIVGSIVNDGEILVNSVGNLTSLRIGGVTTLTGGGKIEMSDNANNGINSGATEANSAVLDNVNNTIEGAGEIISEGVYLGDLSVINEAAGVIDADQATALEITGPVTNKGVVEATGAGGLNAFYLTLDQSDGGELLAKGGDVDFNNSDIIGGTLTSTGGGIFESTGGGEFDGTGTLPVTITRGSEIEILNEQTLTITGNIANSGEIFENATGNYADLYIGGTTSLTGSGKILLSDSATNDIFDYPGGATLTNVSETIEGAGQIISRTSLTLVNDAGGTIEALDSDNALKVATASFTNNGTAEAIQGATLSLTAPLTNISNDALHSGGSVLTGGKYVVIDPITGGAGAGSASNIAINDDQITTLAAAVTLTGATSTLTANGVALSSSLLDVASGGSLTLNYSANSGTQQVFDTGANPLEIGGSVTINGATMTAASITIDKGGALILRPSTDAGSASATGALSDSGALRISADAEITVGGALTLTSGVTLVDDGEVLIDGGGSIAGAITGTGTLLLSGGDTTFATGAKLSTADWSLSGSGTATLGEGLDYSGAFSGGALTKVALNGGALTLKGATTLAGVTVSSASGRALNLDGATSVSGLTIAGDAVVANDATATQSGISITVGDNVSTDKAELYNAAAGVWNIAGDSDVTRGADAASLIVNLGLFEKTKGNAMSKVATAVTNSGSILAESGVFDLQGSLAGTGADQVGDGATLQFDGTVAGTQKVEYATSGGEISLDDLDAAGVQLFHATISGWGLGDSLDVGTDFGTGTKFNFTESSGNASGVLHLTNGAAHAAIAFAGDFSNANFTPNVNASGATVFTFHSS